MSRGSLALAFTLVAGLALAAGTHAALAAGTVQRPTSGGTYAFKTPEATPYVGARAVVHYVTSGPDAPALNDDNGDGYPDYVEQVAAAADVALAYYQQHGFKVPLADTAGPDTKPDIYIDSLPPGTFGLTFGEQTGEGGSFVLVSPRLDPSVPKAFGGLNPTVAHELFALSSKLGVSSSTEMAHYAYAQGIVDTTDATSNIAATPLAAVA